MGRARLQRTDARTRVTARYRFAVNLRADTIGPEFTSALRPWGWLAAPANTTAATRRFAAAAASRGRCIVADNGNFAEIGRVATMYRTPADALRDRLTMLETQLDRTATRRDLSPQDATAYDDLARGVRRSVRSRRIADDEQLTGQLTLAPSVLIGAEDVTAAVLLALDVEPQLLDWPRARWRGANLAVARRAQRAVAADPALAGRYYAVASALDWTTAYDAGRAFAAAALDRVAMGFGAYMADDHGADVVRIDGRWHRLTGRVPQRYLRTAVVAAGFLAGYREERGRAPDAFHFLGLGAPIMMGIVALAAVDVGLVSFDAMSPIKDAVEGTLYTTRPTYLKLRTRSIAFELAAGRRSWNCPCAFCRRFVAAHPFDLATAQAGWPGGPVGAVALRPGGPLYDALPLLAEPAAGPFRRVVSAARMGHNHWVLNLTCARLTRYAARGTLADHVSNVVDAYGRATSAPRFAAAVRLGLDVVTGAFPPPR